MSKPFPRKIKSSLSPSLLLPSLNHRRKRPFFFFPPCLISIILSPWVFCEEFFIKLSSIPLSSGISRNQLPSDACVLYPFTQRQRRGKVLRAFLLPQLLLTPRPLKLHFTLHEPRFCGLTTKISFLNFISLQQAEDEGKFLWTKKITFSPKRISNSILWH